jgi:hypothetical protein
VLRDLCCFLFLSDYFYFCQFVFLSKIYCFYCSCLLGSGEGHTAYIYKRTNKAPLKPTLPNQVVLKIPGRASLNEADSECYCDQAFFAGSALAVGPVADLREYVSGVVAEHLSSARPKRERKARVITSA